MKKIALMLVAVIVTATMFAGDTTPTVKGKHCTKQEAPKKTGQKGKAEHKGKVEHKEKKENKK